LGHRFRTKAQILAKLFDGYNLVWLLPEMILDLFDKVPSVTLASAGYYLDVLGIYAKSLHESILYLCFIYTAAIL